MKVTTGKVPNKLYDKALIKPTSKITDDLIVANPYIITPSKTFKKPFDAIIKCGDKDAKIYYTIDGTIPTVNSKLYTTPIPVAKNTTIKAVAIKNGK